MIAGNHRVADNINQPHITAAEAMRDHPTRRAALWPGRRLHRDAEPAAGRVGRRSDDVESVQTHEQVTTKAVGQGVGGSARPGTP
jgi:hypothetical protein